MDIQQILAPYGIQAIRIERVEQGSTNSSHIVEGDTGRFFLRRYARPEESGWNRILCTQETIRYEHALLRYAAENGIPCVPPMANAAGNTVTEVEGRYYALFAYTAAEPYRPPRSAQGIREAELLARYHNVMERYPVTRQRQGWGYAGRLRAWFHENQRGIGTVDEILAWAGALDPNNEAHALLSSNAAYIRELVDMLDDEFPEELYAQGPLVVNHGDYIPKNIGVRDEGLVLFDFDFCVRELRIYDLAMLLGYTAGEEHTGRYMDAQVAANIVRAYRERAYMTADELCLAPYMLIAFRLRILLGNLGILKSTGSYPPALLRRNIEALRWLAEHRPKIVEMLRA
jgi:Ser/Thr protein kinase RdoA (MazF antagonist)